MDKYIGTKIVRAEPMTVIEAQKLLQRKIKPAVYADDDGYLVGYGDGYQSWSPKDVFEKAYRPITGMTFGLALEALKDKHRVYRAGWHSKGMWISLVEPDEYAVAGVIFGDAERAAPYIAMRTADKAFAPFTPTQCDVLAEDWTIVV
jgi:hypothetical protein